MIRGRKLARDRKRVGRRSQTALVIERVTPNQFSLVAVRVPKPTRVDAALLSQLYELGALYHGAHETLSKHRDRALDAVYAMAKAHPGRERREPRRELLHAADSLEDSARKLAALVGVENVAVVAMAAAELIDSFPAEATDDELEYLFARLQGLLPHREAVMVNMPPPAPEDRLLAYEMRSDVPVGDGAMGYETIQHLRSPPWTDVAWFAWCAAGRGVKWSHAWVTWPPLERYPFETIGRPARMTAAAVRESRRRQRVY